MKWKPTTAIGTIVERECARCRQVVPWTLVDGADGEWTARDNEWHGESTHEPCGTSMQWLKPPPALTGREHSEAISLSLIRQWEIAAEGENETCDRCGAGHSAGAHKRIGEAARRCLALVERGWDPRRVVIAERTLRRTT